MRIDWRKLAVFGMALIVLVLALLYPLAPQAPVPAAAILLPVVLFGLVLVPLTLWPASDFGRLILLPLRARAPLFQRPPPQSLR
jgi:hypothetical protein